MLMHCVFVHRLLNTWLFVVLDQYFRTSLLGVKSGHVVAICLPTYRLPYLANRSVPQHSQKTEWREVDKMRYFCCRTTRRTRFSLQLPPCTQCIFISDQSINNVDYVISCGTTTSCAGGRVITATLKSFVCRPRKSGNRTSYSLTSQWPLTSSFSSSSSSSSFIRLLQIHSYT